MPALTEALFPDTVMAMAILDASAGGRGLQIGDISKLFVVLEEAGVPIRDVALRSVPDGVYSEDVESFVGRFLAAGYAKARSPIKFEPEGLRVCREMVQKALHRNPDAVMKVASALNFHVMSLIGQGSP